MTLAGRLLLAATVGLGVDEAYTVSTARTFELSTFDHPPLAWWLARVGRMLGAESTVAVRLPFIALFALTTWLAYHAGRKLFGRRAGLFAAITINLAPVLGWTTGTFVLPDGPLLAAMLAARLLRLAGAVRAGGRRAALVAADGRRRRPRVPRQAARRVPVPRRRPVHPHLAGASALDDADRGPISRCW